MSLAEDRAVIGRLESLISRLEALGLPVREPAVGPDPFASDLPPMVATGELIESAWGNAVVTRLVGHTTHLTKQASFPAGVATTVRPGVGPFNLAEKGVWLVNFAADITPNGPGWSMVSFYPSNAIDTNPLGFPLVNNEFMENAGANTRFLAHGLWAITVDTGGLDIYFRAATYSGAVDFASLKVNAWTLYAGGPNP